MLKLNSIDINTYMGEEKEPKKRATLTRSKEEKNAVQELLSSALEKYAKEKNNRVKDGEDTVHAINSTLEEFLKTFLVIGYDFNGEIMIISNTKTQQDTDSLSTAVSRFVMHNIRNING